jgi:hypothetical protein
MMAPGAELARGGEEGAAGVERHGAHVHGRHGEAAHLAAAAGHVELVDGGRGHAQPPPYLADGPPRGVAHVLVVGEDGGAHQAVDPFAAKRLLVHHLHPAVGRDADGRCDLIQHGAHGGE